MAASTTRTVPTPHGDGRVTTYRARRPLATLLLSHGAGGGIEARDLQALATYLEQPGGPDEARRFALEAARKATAILEERHDLAASILVGQVRSMAVDLLRSTGMDQASALEALEDAAGRASEIG